MGSLRPTHVRDRSLATLAEQFAFSSDDDLNTVVSGVSISSRDLEAGDLFVALPGANVHGATFVDQAIAVGAVAVLTDAAGAKLAATSGVPVLTTEDPRAALGPVSAWMYRTGAFADDDAQSQSVFGVTGTNGKTSVVYLVTALAEQLGQRVALSSTAERRVHDQVVSSALTTPEANDVHGLIAAAREQQVRTIALEVSAQALSRHRVDAVLFDVVGFTNLSHDHLDDYGSMTEYFAAKRELFTPERAKRGVVLLESEWGERLVAESRIPVTTIALDHRPADWHVRVLEERADHTSFELVGRDRVLRARVPLLGAFSAANAALALVMLNESGIDLDRLADVIARDGEINVFVPGRAERVSADHGPLVLIDYAHTPDAFAQLLSALRHVAKGRIIMVFGADGDRDRSKRAEMGAIAAHGADQLVITDFHPRFEDPASIRAALIAGAREAVPDGKLEEIADPRLAIRRAIALADADDIVVYAGPGHEDYQEVAGTKIPYSAREDARAALREAGWLND